MGGTQPNIELLEASCSDSSIDSSVGLYTVPDVEENSRESRPRGWVCSLACYVVDTVGTNTPCEQREYFCLSVRTTQHLRGRSHQSQTDLKGCSGGPLLFHLTTSGPNLHYLDYLHVLL